MTELEHPFDYTKGILQAIGFKEFAPYLELSEKEKKTPHGEALLASCIEDVERSTRRYAKRQITWIKNRTLKMKPEVPIYQLDGSDLASWEEMVVGPALDITSNLIHSKPLPSERRVKVDDDDEDRAVKHKQYSCEPCGRTLRGHSEWQAHLKSRGHRRTIDKSKKKHRGPPAEEDAPAKRTEGSE